MVTNLIRGVAVSVLVSNRRPWVWLNAHDPRRATPEQVRDLGKTMRGIWGSADG